MKTYINIDGIECVVIDNKDGSTWSGLKSAYDEMIAQQEHLTENLAEDSE